MLEVSNDHRGEEVLWASGGLQVSHLALETRQVPNRHSQDLRADWPGLLL